MTDLICEVTDFWIAQDRDGDPIAKMRIETNYKRPDVVYRLITDINAGVEMPIPFRRQDVSKNPLGPDNIYFLTTDQKGNIYVKMYASRPEVEAALKAGDLPYTKCTLTRLGVNHKGDRQGYVSFDLALNHVKTEVFCELE